MANSVKEGFTFEWRIENVSYCWLRKGQSLVSPSFDVGELTPTSWSLMLYPRGITTEDHVGLYLQREYNKNQSVYFGVNFQFAILDNNGLVLKEGNVLKEDFAIACLSGIGEFTTQDKIFGTNRQQILPQDILIVKCTIWIDGMFMKARHDRSVRTIFTVNRKSFLWHINGFSTLDISDISSALNLRFEIMNKPKEVSGMFCLCSDIHGEINLQIILADESLKSFSFKLCVIDSEGEKVNLGSYKLFGWEDEVYELVISREQLMRNESMYLPNDVLTLECEYAFSTGDILHIRGRHNFGTISPVVTKKPLENEKTPIVAQNQPHQPQDLVDDLKSIYSDGVLCDIELRTSTKTFPAHKTILSARSPVFRRMFSNDMKEKNSGRIDITDLEDDTVHRMLLYIYTDALGDLQFESASKLYSAADKYAILSLKEKCSCFLKDNVTSTSACGLLILADRHQDEDLKRAAQDYILSHDKEVFGSPEWKDFMATNLQLAADTMYRKVYPS